MIAFIGLILRNCNNNDDVIERKERERQKISVIYISGFKNRTNIEINFQSGGKNQL